MNCLCQLPNGIFATEEQLEVLKKKENCKILVFSDSHGDQYIVRDIFEKFGASCDAAVFAGDGIYDLVRLMEKASAYEEAKRWLPPVIAFVRGNNDPSIISTSFCKKIFVPKRVILEAGCRRILITHGNEEGVYYSTEPLEDSAELENANAVIYGHTHFPVENMHIIYSMNPGSCSCPRFRSKPGCAVLEVLGRDISSIFYCIEADRKTKFVPFFPERFAY